MSMDQADIKERVLFVMGVSGSGKSVIGSLLAQELGIPFVDADDYHPETNIQKMSQGIPLNDDDRGPWLDELNRLSREDYKQGCVIACSALKEAYRIRLNHGLETRVSWIYLRGTYDQIFDRMNRREGHFMGASMLQSQFDTLEEPIDAITLDIVGAPDEIVINIKKALLTN